MTRLFKEESEINVALDHLYYSNLWAYRKG